MESYTITDQQSGDVQTTNYTFHASYDRATELVTNTVAGSTTSSKDRVYNYDETYWVSDIVDNLSAQSIVYDYDDNGNTISKLDASQSPAVSTVYNYNSRNQLLDAAAGPLGAEVGQGTYDYNYSGMRIRHLNSERGDVEYIYDGNSVLEELNNNANSLIAHYRYADRLLSLNTPTDSQFYLFASLGTTANLSDESGNVEKSYRTDPYGEITHQEGTSVNKQVFTGQEHDEQTGLIYFGARYYDPDTARFITQDTYLGEPGTAPSLHRYLYAYSNPTYYVDLNGYDAVSLNPAIPNPFTYLGGDVLMSSGDRLGRLISGESLDYNSPNFWANEVNRNPSSWSNRVSAVGERILNEVLSDVPSYSDGRSSTTTSYSSNQSSREQQAAQVTYRGRSARLNDSLASRVATRDASLAAGNFHLAEIQTKGIDRQTREMQEQGLPVYGNPGAPEITIEGTHTGSTHDKPDLPTSTSLPIADNLPTTTGGRTIPDALPSDSGGFVASDPMPTTYLSESTVQGNRAKGKAGEAITEANLRGDGSFAGKQVTFETSTGKRSVIDFVTNTEGGKSIVETKTGKARKTSGQRQLFEDVENGRAVIPRGQNAVDAGLTPGQPVVLDSCSIDRPC